MNTEITKQENDANSPFTYSVPKWFVAGQKQDEKIIYLASTIIQVTNFCRYLKDNGYEIKVRLA